MSTRGTSARWLPSIAGSRQYSRELAAVDHVGDVGERKIENIGRVQGRAMFMTMQINALREQAERAAPSGGELYALLALTGVVEMAAVISRMNREY